MRQIRRKRRERDDDDDDDEQTGKQTTMSRRGRRWMSGVWGIVDLDQEYEDEEPW